jgi:uncharacterized protein YyaL (SSP411 family)
MLVPCGVRGAVSWIAKRTQTWTPQTTSISTCVAVKVDFDSAPELVAQLQRAQAVLNLPAGLPLTSFITPDGKLYFGAGYLPAERKAGKRSFREAAEQALKLYADKSKIEEESFQLEVAKKT